MSNVSSFADRRSKYADRDWACFNSFLDFSLADTIRVCIVCHSGKVDLSALSYGKKPLLRYLTEIQGGLVSLQPIRYVIKSMKNANNTRFYSISLSVADTLCHAPAGKKKLKDLGEVLGIEKVSIDNSQKNHMKVQEFLGRSRNYFQKEFSKKA